MRQVLANNFDTSFRDIASPGQEPVVANLAATGARTMAQRVGHMPRIDCEPPRNRSRFEEAQKRAERHEKRLHEYLGNMHIEMTLLQASYWLVVHDLCALVTRPSQEMGQPVIEVKDPLTCYPGTVWPHKPEIYDCLFAQKMPAYQAVRLYPDIARYIDPEGKGEIPTNVVIGEFYTNDYLCVALLEPTCRILEEIPNPCPGEPMVHLGRGFSPDLDFHGQFDSVIPVLVAQAKMMALVQAYVEQQVFAETVVQGQMPEIKSNGGRWAYGPNAVNVIQGGEAQKLLNNMSPQVGPELDRLERMIRIGGAFPAQLSGEPAASIATGKGTEALLSAVDDNTEYWRKVLGDAFVRALDAIPSIAKTMQSEGWEDFSDDVRTHVFFQPDLDPSSTIQQLQLLGPGVIPKRLIRERSALVHDPDETAAEVEVEQLRDVLLQGLLAKATQPDPMTGQTMDPAQVASIIKLRREKQVPIEDVLAVVAQEAAAASAAAAPQGQGAPSLEALLGPMMGAAGGQPGGFEGGQPAAPGTQPPIPAPA